MDLHYLMIFNEVAKYESYKMASATLHISQPALSIQMKKLEEQIGLKLFNKIGNRVHLSENGIMLQEYTNRIFGIVEELENSISNQSQFIGGSLLVGGSNTPGTYIMPEIIGEFSKQYPNIKVNLHIANTFEIANLVDNGTVDIAVNGGDCVYGNYIYVEKLYEDKLVLVASPENLFCAFESIDVKDLRLMKFVVHKTESQLYKYYKNFIGEIGIPENISMYLGSIDAIKKAVSSNLGISLIPYAAVKLEIQYGILTPLNFTDYQREYPYHLVFNKNKALSATSRRFIEFIKGYMKRMSDEDAHLTE